MLITLVRHGESTDNVSWLWSGFSDPQLTSLGLRQVELVSARFKDTKFSRIYSSDLQRARLTGEAILAHNRYRLSTPPLIIDTRIREINFGELEGTPCSKLDLKKKWDRSVKFPGGESFKDCFLRASAIVDEILNEYLNTSIEKENSTEERIRLTDKDEPHILIATHGGWISEFLRVLSLRAGITFEFSPIPNTSVTTVRVSLPSRSKGIQPPTNGKTLKLEYLFKYDVSHIESILN
ncbi:uncharacterized protein VTP21DRAFT_11232 [Calcarisporiella thermophila]|uniref:uncharacterized protein n=1 Tax=Calcarisporiella thermophila TaxID=911321 RepID=UPI003744371B